MEKFFINSPGLVENVFLSNSLSSKEKESKEPKISLAKVLCKAYTWEFAKSNIWKLFYDILVFANPFLLQYVSGLN